MLDNINELIKELTEYGRRQVKIPATYPNLTILAWSNGSRGWYTFNSDYAKGLKKDNMIELDANQLIVPYKKEKVITIIEHLDELPLYKNSFEVTGKITI